MSQDRMSVSEAAQLGAQLGVHEPQRWRCHTRVEKRWGDDPAATPYEVVEVPGNLLLFGGASCQWQTLIGNGTATAGAALTYFNAANAAIGVGDSAVASAGGQTNLQAATNKLRVGMDSTFPAHTDGVTSAAASISFRATFGTAQANFVWAEWAIFNSSTDAAGRMLNRVVQALGTKTSAAAWTLLITISLS